MAEPQGPIRRYDLLVLDYGGVCTLSHHEFIAAGRTPTETTPGERPAALTTIRLAQQAGVIVLILSNELSPDWTADSPVLTSADHVVACGGNGIAKPDRRAFQRALLVARCAAERTLCVDDQIDNIRGAQAAGMDALLFDITEPEGSWAEIARLITAD